MQVPAEPHDAYAAFRHRPFRTYLASFALAVISSQLLSTAAIWQVHELTGSALNLGWLGLVQALPVLSLSLFAGHGSQ